MKYGYRYRNHNEFISRVPNIIKNYYRLQIGRYLPTYSVGPTIFQPGAKYEFGAL